LLGSFWEVDKQQQWQMIQLNIAALTELTRLFFAGFVERRRGRILNVASTAAVTATRLFKVAMSAETVAAIGCRAMKRGKPLVIARRLNALGAFLTRFAPMHITAAMARRMQEV
jgi:short-subunit dehydrogenase